MGTPYEIAKGTVFLASDDATFITGSALGAAKATGLRAAFWFKSD
jgi:NAD(P)-dependent dehydrogenase (short-subunit alcohol dehydrogenase family)